MLGCSSPEEVLSTPLARAARRLRRPRRGRAAVRPARAARAPRAGRRGAASDAHADGRQGHRRGALVGDQGDAGPRRARRRPARGQHHRGRHRRAPGRAPAALPVGGEHARLLVAGHRRHARQGRGRGGARAGRLVLRRRARRARRRAARGASAPATPTATRWSACATRCRWTPTTPARPPTCCGPGVAGPRSATSTTPRRGPGPAATRSRPPRCVASGTRSAMVVPMTAGDRAIGVVTLGTSRSARRLGEAELALAAELGRRAGIAVENARLHAARTHIATTLQRSLLPPRLPIVPGVTIAARFRAAGRDERGRRRLLRRLRRRRRVDGRRRRRDRQGAGRRHHHLAGALHDAHGGDVRALARAPCWRASTRRWAPTPTAARSAPRCARASSPPRTGPCCVALARGGHPPPFLSRPRAAPRPSARPGRCSAPSTAARGRSAMSSSAPATRSSSTPTASPTPAARTASCFGEERLSELLAARRGARRRRGGLADRRRAAGLRARPAARRCGPARSALRGGGAGQRYTNGRSSPRP